MIIGSSLVLGSYFLTTLYIILFNFTLANDITPASFEFESGT